MKVLKVEQRVGKRLKGGSLPDIDTDFPGLRREEIKKYMEDKYGIEYVCSVGTYTTLQLKAAIKDVGKYFNLSFEETNFITKCLGDKDKSLDDLFETIRTDKKNGSILANFVKKHPDLINTIPLVLQQVKASSVHACATIIFPKDKNMYENIPVRSQNGIIVSEWEGGELENAGYLKEDILGIKQLDKFARIVELIKRDTKEDVDIFNLPLDDSEVFRFFQNGWNGDVFHFGSHGLTGYCKQMQPQTIHDLVAGISLYRPGAMENNFHNEYVDRMQGEKDVQYIPGLEEVTKETYGLCVYQEQVMQACSHIANFSLVEADMVRKAMGKKKAALLDKYRSQFIEGGEKNGFTHKGLVETWEMLEKFAKYGFNKSHAAAYTIMGYICQWLKVYYPIQYWAAAFELSDEKKFPEYISEIYHTGNIKILPCDINYSAKGIVANQENRTLFWSLSAAKNVGEAAVNQIIDDRDKNGEYFSFDDFYSRHKFKGSKVNKRTIEALILAGAFDRLEHIVDITKRIELIDYYRKEARTKIDEDKDIFCLDKDKLDKEIWWKLQEKLVSSLAFIDYQDLCRKELKHGEYIESSKFDSCFTPTMAKIGGYVDDIIIREGKKGKWASIVLESNYTFINITVWAAEFSKFKEKMEDLKGKCVLVSGTVKHDDFKKKNALFFDKKSELIVL